MSDQWTHLDVDEIVGESQKAFEVRIGKNRYWIPMSQISDYEDYSLWDKNCVMSVKTWFCEKENING